VAAKQDKSDSEVDAGIDRSGMLKVLEKFPGQVAEAIEIGQSELALPAPAGVSSVVVLGMGGSGISGDVVAALSADAGLKLPVFTCKGYELPGFVGPDTLVFAVSYSGNTEETLDTMGQAMERGARVVAVSAGGKVTEIAESNSIPLFRIPAGLQPRAALGYLAVPIMSALDRMGMVPGTVERFRAALPMLEARLEEYGPAAAEDDNGPLRLARELIDFVPIVYGAEGYLAVAASRWKAQFNEMAKVPSFHNYFPELNHNETVGWENLPEVCRSCHVIVLGEPALHPRIEKRVKITIELIQESVGGVTRICARGANAVERLLDLVYFGDFASVYLALATGQDPTPIARIDEFKKRMAG